jgi:hypothetical protein
VICWKWAGLCKGWAFSGHVLGMGWAVLRVGWAWAGVCMAWAGMVWALHVVCWARSGLGIGCVGHGLGWEFSGPEFGRGWSGLGMSCDDQRRL